MQAMTEQASKKVDKMTENCEKSDQCEEAKSLTKSKLILCYQEDYSFVDAELISFKDKGSQDKESQPSFASLKPTQEPQTQDHEEKAERLSSESEALEEKLKELGLGLRDDEKEGQSQEEPEKGPEQEAKGEAHQQEEVREAL